MEQLIGIKFIKKRKSSTLTSFRYILFYNFNFTCQGLESDPATAKWVASGVWTFYMAKLSELLDTVFFVLRKSNRQITSLHLHHHTLMPITAWCGTTFYPGGQGILVGFFNAIVHIVMYTYYLITGFGDEYKKHLWWKKYVTILQLVQFLIIGIHHINSFFYACDYLVSLKILTTFYSCFFTYTFGKFYYENYIINPKITNRVGSSLKKHN
ncbi:unnamed protein product [Euphydryas editha]|uniref:Elongation of very long chain fatty acids protein n=1 Tax=Euphydryas editha TaxID=104508 RepID=A0AAU9V6V8_EUPED|nr:unnamed protein product [Euphydryas editha]